MWRITSIEFLLVFMGLLIVIRERCCGKIWGPLEAFEVMRGLWGVLQCVRFSRERKSGGLSGWDGDKAPESNSFTTAF